MTTFYDELQQAASELLDEFKQGTITLTRLTQAAPDAQTPWAPGATTDTTVYTLDAVVAGVPKNKIDGSLIVSSDLMVTAAVIAGLTPVLSDTLSVDGVIHAIKKIEPVPAAGTPALYNFYVAGIV